MEKQFILKNFVSFKRHFKLNQELVVLKRRGASCKYPDRALSVCSTEERIKVDGIRPSTMLEFSITYCSTIDAMTENCGFNLRKFELDNEG